MGKTKSFYRLLYVVPNYFGKGDTIKEARDNCRKAGGSLKGPFRLFIMPDGAENVFVDDFGCIRWKWAKGADQSKTTELIDQRGD
jgi:hypothetical protein